MAGVVAALAGNQLLGKQLVNRNGGQPPSQEGGAEACLEKMAHEGAVALILIPQAERASAGRTIFEAQAASVRPRFAHADVPFLAPDARSLPRATIGLTSLRTELPKLRASKSEGRICDPRLGLTVSSAAHGTSSRPGIARGRR